MYIVIVSDSIRKLESNVNRKITEGYTLQGGIAIRTSKYKEQYAQAMIKVKTEK